MSSQQPTPNQASQTQQPEKLPVVSQPTASAPLPPDPYSPAAIILATGVLVTAIGKTESQPTPNQTLPSQSQPTQNPGVQSQQPVQIVEIVRQPHATSLFLNLYSPAAIILTTCALVAAIGHALSRLNNSR